MLAVSLYWVLVVAAGVGLALFIPLRWRPLELLAAGVAVGLVGSTLGGFLLALAVGVGPVAALLPPAVLLAGAGVGHGLLRFRRLRRGTVGMSAWVRGRGARWEVGAAVGAGLLCWFLFARALQSGPDGTLLAAANLWADWSVHTSYAQSFLLGGNLPPGDSLEVLTAMRYPFLVDFQPALLEALGQNLAGALDMPSLAIAWAAMVLIFHLALRATHRPGAASLALALVLFGGGLGFIGMYGDGCSQLAATNPNFRASACTSLSTATPGAVVAFVGHLPAELTHLPRYYDGQNQANPPVADLQWYEPLLVYWMPQRDFAYGMALVALASLLLWDGVRRRRRSLAVAAGLVAAALPLFNPFGYLFAGLVALWWSGRQRWWQGTMAFLLPAVILGLPQLLFVISGPHGAASGPLGPNLFPALDLGWLSHAVPTCTAAQAAQNGACAAIYLQGAAPGLLAAYVIHTLAEPSFYGGLLGFWLANTGVFVLLAGALAVLPALRGRLGRELRRRRLLGFWAPAWIAFLIANVVVTQPWNWDNTKLLSYWYLGAAIPVAFLLTSAARGWAGRGLSFLVAASLLLSGVLSLLAGQEGLSNLAQAAPQGAVVTMDGGQAVRVAREVMTRTAKTAVFLTEGQPNDPVTTLAGRRVVLGYYGWLWSYGQPLAQRYRAVQEMYAGCPATGACRLGELLRHYRVSYVEFESGDYNQISANLAWYRTQHLPVLVRTTQYEIFKVTSLWSPLPR